VKATEVTAGLAESNGSLLPGLWRDSLHVTCGLTACTPGSAPGPALGNDYGKTLIVTPKSKTLYIFLLVLFRIRSHVSYHNICGMILNCACVRILRTRRPIPVVIVFKPCIYVFLALPYVRQYDRPKNIIEGDPFQSECYAWGYPPVTVVWHRDAVPVVAETHRVQFKNGSVENSTLRIEDVLFEDSADYTCVVTNELGSVNATVSVRIKGTEFAMFLSCCHLCITGIFVNNKSHCHLILAGVWLSISCTQQWYELA